MKLPNVKLLFPRNGKASGRFALADPNNPDAEIAPRDLENLPEAPEPTEAEHETVRFVMDLFQDAQTARMPVEREMVLGVAFDEGRQWLGWDNALHRCVNLMDEEDEDKYVTANLIGPLVLKVAALTTMTQPDASPAPSTEAPLDRAAAREAGAILAACDRRFQRPVQTLRRVRGALAQGCAFLELGWDPRAGADIPVFGKDGTVVGKTHAPGVGNVVEHVLPAQECYIDPVPWEDISWFIHRAPRPLSWVQERYGNPDGTGPGWQVEPDCADAYTGLVDSYQQGASSAGGISALFSGWFGGGSNQKSRKAVVVYRLWHKPTPRFPQGRFIVVAGDRLLYAGPLPYQFPETPGPRGWLPIVRLVWKEASGHPYGQGLVSQLAPLQVGLNRMLTRILDKIDADIPTLVVEKGSGIGPDAYQGDEIEELRRLRKVYYEPGTTPPQWQPMLPLPGEVLRFQDAMWIYMQHIAGIHDPLMGGAPPGVTAGISLELLQQGDKTQHAPFLTQIEQNAVEIGEKEIALFAQFAPGNLPRLMGLDRSGNPGTAHMAAMAFRALTGGGSCEVLVKPGSAAPKSPAAQNEQVMNWFDRGLFGPPGTPQAALGAVRMLSDVRTDEIVEHLQALLEEQQAQTEQAAAVQAQAMQAQMQAGVGPPVPGPGV